MLIFVGASSIVPGNNVLWRRTMARTMESLSSKVKLSQFSIFIPSSGGQPPILGVEWFNGFLLTGPDVKCYQIHSQQRLYWNLCENTLF